MLRTLHPFNSSNHVQALWETLLFCAKALETHGFNCIGLLACHSPWYVWTSFEVLCVAKLHCTKHAKAVSRKQPGNGSLQKLQTRSLGSDRKTWRIKNRQLNRIPGDERETSHSCHLAGTHSGQPEMLISLSSLRAFGVQVGYFTKGFKPTPNWVLLNKSPRIEAELLGCTHENSCWIVVPDSTHIGLLQINPLHCNLDCDCFDTHNPMWSSGCFSLSLFMYKLLPSSFLRLWAEDLAVGTVLEVLQFRMLVTKLLC